jgi:histidyl-tRNA synthetase
MGASKLACFMATLQTLPGFREFYPEALATRNHIFRHWRQAARAYGFAEYDAPVLEPLDLYKKKSGDEIEGQLFSFTDKGGREVALRPEMTPTVCFFQFNADIFGEPGPEAEIELIALLVQCLRSFGLTAEDFYVRLSDRNLWFYYLEDLGLDDARVRAVLGAVDKYEKAGDAAFKDYEEAYGPLPVELREKIHAFLAIKSFSDLETALAGRASEKLSARLGDWRRLLGGLQAMGLSDFVQVDLGVVRGLAYYTGFVFEAFDRKGELRAIAGGGRYDDLVAKLGGPELPAVGFAIGDMTFQLLLEARGLLPQLIDAADIYVVVGGEAERPAALADVYRLRESGFRVEYPLKELAFGKQFKAADQCGAQLAIIYGADELARGVVKLRDLGQRAERELPRAQLLEAVRDCFRGA